MSRHEPLAPAEPADLSALQAGPEASKIRTPAPTGLGERAAARRAGSAADAGAESPRPRWTVVSRAIVHSQPALRTRVVTSLAEFEALGPAWRALLDECPDANVFISHEWLFAWYTAYAPAAQLAVVVVEDEGRLRGVAPLMIEEVRCAGMTARRLRFIGDGTGETDHVSFVTPRRDRTVVLHALLRAIGRLDWDAAEFNQMPETSETTAALLRWLDEEGLRFHSTSAACPVRRLPTSPEQVVASLPSRLRTSIRSSRRKLEQRCTVEFGLHSRPDEIEPALRNFFANHESRWQGKGIAGAFSNERRRRFYEQLTPRLLERGWLRFFYLKLDGVPVAQQYCFAVDGTVMLLQEGFDFRHAEDNVGNVLRAMVFEHLVGQGVHTYDFLAGTSRHKASWSDGTVNDLRVHCGRRSWRGWWLHALPQQWARAKASLRPWRDRLRRHQPATANGQRAPEDKRDH